MILVTSALPREGKTTAAANLAVTLAQLGDSTVLVDADLRKPGVGRMLNLGTAKYAGLCSYLAGVSSLDLVSVPTLPFRIWLQFRRGLSRQIRRICSLPTSSRTPSWNCAQGSNSS